MGNVRVKVLVAYSCLTLCNPMDCSPPGSSVHGILQAKNIGVGSHSRLQGIFTIQRLNLGLPYRRQILYHLSHQGSQLSIPGFIYLLVYNVQLISYFPIKALVQCTKLSRLISQSCSNKINT